VSITKERDLPCSLEFSAVNTHPVRIIPLIILDYLVRKYRVRGVSKGLQLPPPRKNNLGILTTGELGFTVSESKTR
jgi:hypothetical protein